MSRKPEDVLARVSRRRRPWVLAALVGVGLTLGPALAPATIEEQRQRLPPPAYECGDDPIAGIWQAHSFYAHVQQWYMFELDIRRDPEDPAGERLRGTMRSEFWDGGPELAQPPSCLEPGERTLVLENATGRAAGMQLSFDAIDWRDTGLCGPMFGSYLLDHFSGTVDPERMEFQSLLNADAPEWRDVPTVFRRVRCQPVSKDEPEPRPEIRVAPPYQPPEREGCGLWSSREH